MLLVTSSEDQELVKILKKKTFDPIKAVELLNNSLKDFELSESLALNKSSFLTNLPIYVEKLLKKKYSKLSLEASETVFCFLLELVKFCKTGLETCPLEKLLVLNSVLDSCQSFYKPSKNLFCQTDEFRTRLESLNFPHLSFFSYSQVNNYYIFILVSFVQDTKIVDFSKFVGNKLLFDVILSTIDLFKSIKHVLPGVCWEDLSENLFNSAVSLLQHLKNDDLRFVNKENLRSFYSKLEDFIKICSNSEEKWPILEVLELEVAYNLLECQNLDKKFLGAEELNRKMTQIKKREDQKSSHIIYYNLIDKPCKYLTVSIFADWLNNKKLLISLYSGSPHIEIIKKFTDILKFLYSSNFIPQLILSTIWENSFNKHQSDKEVFLGVIHELMFNLSSEDLKFIRNKIENLDVKLVDIQILKILRQFNYLNHKLAPNIFLVPKEEFYEVFAHLEIFWKLAGEDALKQGVSKDIHVKAGNYLSECLKNSSNRPARLMYAEKCIEVLENIEKPASFIEILMSILDCYPNAQVSDTDNKVKVLQSFEKKLAKALFGNIIRSKKVLLKDFPRNFDEYCEKCQQILRFFRYLGKVDPKILSFDRLDKLWTVFVVNRLCIEESDLYFQFLSSLVADQPVITEAQIGEIYSKFLLRLSPKLMTKPSFKCFEKYFLKVNKIYNKVILDNSDFLISVTKTPLISLSHLWELVLTCTNEIVFDESGFLLKRIHRNVQNFSVSEQKHFISTCFAQLQLILSENTDEKTTKVLRCIQIILDFFKYCENSVQVHPMQSQQQNFDLKVKIKYFFYRGNTQGTIFEDFYNTTHWGSAKEMIAQRLGKNMNQLSFSVDNKIVWGDNFKTLEELNVDKFLEIEVNESDNSSSFDEHFAQLKCIFEYLEDDVIRLALQKEGNSLDEAVSLLTSEDAVAALRSEVCDKGMQVDIIHPKVDQAPKKPEILKFVSQNEEFCNILENLGKFEDDRVLTKVMELLENLPNSAESKNRVKNFASSGLDEILDRSSGIRLWRNLRIILKILEKKKPEGWVNNFFEYGGILIISEMLTQTSQLNCFFIESLRLQMDILTHFLKNFFNNSFFSIEELLNLPELSQSLIQIISNTILSSKIPETLIESALTLLISLPNQSLLQTIYADEVFKQLSLSLLPNSMKDSLRQKIVDTIKTLIVSLGSDCSQYFWNLLSNGIPSIQSPRCKEFFQALSMVLETSPNISQSFIDDSIQVVMSRDINEDTQEDFLLAGYLDLIGRLLRNHQSANEKSLISFVFSALFELDPLNDFGKDSKSLPLLKKPATRKAGLNLLILLIQKFPEDSENVKKLIAEQHPVAKLEKIYDKENQPRAACGFVGLRNFGCTCYLNSVLQQLFMIQQFQSGILFVEEPKTEDLQDNIVHQLKVIIGNLKYSKKQCFEPSDFCKAFKDFEGQSINVKVQQDADEFLNLLFDKIEENLKVNNKNFLRNIIGGNLVHEISSTDPSFPYKGVREEHFFRISLDIRNIKNLQMALDQYVYPEILDGDNKYYCEEHNTKVNATKRCLLGNLCNTIFIHLKRFEFKYLEMKREKINDKFEFPDELNLKNWCVEDSLADEYYEYELSGVVIHSGSADSGHYFSLIKDREKMKWFKFDDRYVQDYDLSNLQNDCFGKEQNFMFNFEFECMSNAYMLVYERKEFLPVEIELTDDGFESQRQIKRQVNEENTEFLQDLMYFEESYLEFLIDFLRIENNLPDYDHYECEFTKSRVLELEDLQNISFVHQLKQILDKNPSNPSNTDPIPIKSLKSSFIFVLELLIKAEKLDWFTKLSKIVFEKIKSQPSTIFWVLDLFTFNKVLLFSAMNSVKQDNIKEQIMEFILDCLSITLFSLPDRLNSKQILVSNAIDSANDYDSIEFVTEEIYKSPISRFIEYLLNSGIQSFKGFYNIEMILLSTIENFSTVPQFSELFTTNSALSFLYNLYNSPTTKDLDKILVTVRNLLLNISKNPEFTISECKDADFIQSFRFTEFLLKNSEFFKVCITDLSKNNEKISEYLIEVSCENFMKRPDLAERWKILRFIQEILLINEEKKIMNLRKFLQLKFGSFNKVSLFEDIFMSFQYTNVTKALIVIWWGSMLKDETVSIVSRENIKVFNGMKNLAIETFAVKQLESIGMKEPNKLYEESKNIVNLLFD